METLPEKNSVSRRVYEFQRVRERKDQEDRVGLDLEGGGEK